MEKKEGRENTGKQEEAGRGMLNIQHAPGRNIL